MTDRPKRKFNPTKPRHGEQIGGGWIVLRRGYDTGRIRPSFKTFEHPTREAAEAEAARLAALVPGYQFDVLGVVASQMVVAVSMEAQGLLGDRSAPPVTA
jgi:hypothetical protein